MHLYNNPERYNNDMKKIAFMSAFIITLLLGTFTASAVDLPIDIDIITGDRGSGEAYTANINTELLTPNAYEITQSINEHTHQKREELTSSLFLLSSDGEVLSIYEQIAASATNTALFSQPSDYSGMRMINDGSSIPLWIIISLFAICCIGGFVLARILMERRREKESVH